MVAPNARVLLVEDDDDSRRATSRLLRCEGYVVVEATGVAAAAQLAPLGFDVLVTDLLLRDGTGWDLYRRLGAARPLPAVAVSGSVMPEDVSRSMAAGFCAHLAKPVSFDALRAAIDACVRRATG